ncbi:hypothetical protein F5Y04DRAFT_128176 [Hypomontagnella monticulosa]|nr:hypothetical protein F5Y04DRAFT_128176 [Hypomontagnella monticulosa]
MGFVRKLFLGIAAILAIPILIATFLVARTQYRLVKATQTINNIPSHDPVFSSPAYEQHFGHRTWAKIESFACGIVIPLEAIRTELLEDDGTFASEVFRVMWNARMSTQFNGAPSPEPPTVGAISASDSIRAEVVDVSAAEMAMTITTVPNGFTGGLEVIQTVVNRRNGVAGVLVKYLWHNDVVLPRRWYQYLSIWLQLTGRRLWLVDVLSSVTTTARAGDEVIGDQTTKDGGASAKQEL